jgi:enoyl-CoA hydratase/carnithine racemase
MNIMTDHVVVTDQSGVRAVKMNRPEKKNALTSEMYDAIASAIEQAGTNETIRCVLLTGVPGAFSAGNDLNEFLQAALSGGTGPRPAQRFLHALARNEKPLVAGVQGIAVGIGTTLLFHCDHVIAGTDAQFSTPFVKLGILPEAASSLLAPHMMGHHRAFSLLVMGRPLAANDAKACGLVSAVVAPEQVDAEARRAAEEIAALPPQAVTLARRMIRSSVDEVEARIKEETAAFQERLHSPEARAAFEAFFMRK